MHDALPHEQAAAPTVDAEPAPPPAAITRKPRLVMRDPQQWASVDSITSVDLPPLPRDGRDGSVGGVDAVLEEARTTAASMLEQTRAACEADREAARLAGYEAGYAAGMEAADAETAGLVSTAEQIAMNVAAERERLLADAEGDLVELALVIAEKIVGAAVDVEPELVLEVCRGAMRKAFQRETLVVRAHPEDLAMLREAGPRLAEELGGVQSLQFVEERRVQRGSLIVCTPAGEIDATFEGKAAKLGEALRELVRSRAAERRLRAA